MSVSNSQFLAQLQDLLASDPQRSRTCFLTQKRFTYQPEGEVLMQTPEAEPNFKCLFRATDGHGLKFSTLVEPENAAEFRKQYGSVLKAALISKMKPKKKKVGKSTPSATVNLPKIVGPKRGAGVEKRRRLIRKRCKILLKIRSRQLLKSAANKA